MCNVETMNMSEWCDYLEQVAHDLEVSGLEATAKDYHESARRIDDLMDRIYKLADIIIELKKELG